MSAEVQHVINGEWVDSGSGETFDAINLATVETIAKVAKAAKEPRSERRGFRAGADHGDAVLGNC